MDDEALILWQDVLDEIQAGREADLTCPHCHKKPLVIEHELDGKTKVSCRACGQFLQGRFG